MQQKQIMNLRSEQGGLAISDTVIHAAPSAGYWANFVVITDATLSAIVMPKEESDATAYLGVVYPQGFIFDGPISSITLAGGVVRMYNFIDPSKKGAVVNSQE